MLAGAVALPDATEVSVMVVSSGQLDGAYTSLALSAEPAAPT